MADNLGLTDFFGQFGKDFSEDLAEAERKRITKKLIEKFGLYDIFDHIYANVKFEKGITKVDSFVGFKIVSQEADNTNAWTEILAAVSQNQGGFEVIPLAGRISRSIYMEDVLNQMGKALLNEEKGKLRQNKGYFGTVEGVRPDGKYKIEADEADYRHALDRTKDMYTHRSVMPDNQGQVFYIYDSNSIKKGELEKVITGTKIGVDEEGREIYDLNDIYGRIEGGIDPNEALDQLAQRIIVPEKRQMLINRNQRMFGTIKSTQPFMSSPPTRVDCEKISQIKKQSKLNMITYRGANREP